MLANCYRNCFRLAQENHIRTIAFPAVSTGVYGFPREKAAEIAIREIKAAIDENPEIEKIILVCFNPQTKQAYEKALLAN